MDDIKYFAEDGKTKVGKQWGELMLTVQCEKIEQLDAAHKSNQVHAQIRQATGRRQSACVTTCIEEKDGNIIMEQDKILA